MQKNQSQSKQKRGIKWKNIISICGFLVLLVLVVLMHGKLRALTTQLAYLQDTSDILLSEVSGMQSNIEKTLEQEASMIESYDIEIVDMDFAKGTYDVDISVIPKEYTDKTRVSIFFGTVECTLALDGYAYKGSITLPFDKDFDGNVTFLLSTDKKKNTEVLEGYEGLENRLDQVLSGTLDAAPSYKDGALRLNAECTYMLDGVGRFSFDSLELVAELDDEEIWTRDLLADLALENETGIQRTVDNQLAETEMGSSQKADAVGSVSGGSGSAVYQFEYELQTDEDNTDMILPMEKQHIRIYLRAKSTEGYQFEYDLFGGDYLPTEKKLDQDQFDWSAHSVVYDRRGGKLELN